MRQRATDAVTCVQSPDLTIDDAERIKNMSKQRWGLKGKASPCGVLNVKSVDLTPTKEGVMPHRNNPGCRTAIIMLGLAMILVGFSARHGYAQPPKNTLKIAIIPHRSTMGNEQAYGLLINALEKETGFLFQWTGSKTYDEVIRKIGTNQADIGFVGAFAYIEAREKYGVKLIARTYGENRSESYYSMIITQVDSGLNTLQGLKGKRFVFNDPKSTSGFLFPLVGLQKAGIDIEDFSEVRYVSRHANSLLAVYNKQVDAGAISSTAKEKVDIDFGKIRVLWKSAPIYRGPWIASRSLPEEQRQKIQRALLKISNHQEAPRIFRELGTKGFIKGVDADYDNIREVYKLKQELSKPE
jgi:phosphonate transport system substrate-binding protein